MILETGKDILEDFRSRGVERTEQSRWPEEGNWELNVLIS